MSVKMIDIGYLAGLVEGDGSFGYYGSPSIKVSMTDVEPVRRARNIMAPGGNITSAKTPDQLKTAYCTGAYGRQAIGWMMTMYSLMSPRRKERIREVIAEWKIAVRQITNEDVCRFGHPMTGSNLIVNLNGSKNCRFCLQRRNRERSNKKAIERANAKLQKQINEIGIS